MKIKSLLRENSAKNIGSGHTLQIWLKEAAGVKSSCGFITAFLSRSAQIPGYHIDRFLARRTFRFIFFFSTNSRIRPMACSGFYEFHFIHGLPRCLLPLGLYHTPCLNTRPTIFQFILCNRFPSKLNYKLCLRLIQHR
jgi:hypothetical protein